MRVFLTGATGYIGFNTALALRLAGHDVIGLIRSAEEGKRLASFEIQTVIGDLARPESYADTAAACDGCVHLAMDYTHDTGRLDDLAVRTLLGAATHGHGRPLVYASGVWVYGNTSGGVADESWPLRAPAIVAFRPAVERLVLDAADVRGVVLRNGVVYGQGLGLTAMWFQQAAAHDLRLVGSGANHWAMVHVADLAQGYVRALEAAPGGQAFNLVDGLSPTTADLLAAVRSVTGYAGAPRSITVAEAARTLGPTAEVLALDQQASADRARREFGWTPRQGGFSEDLPRHFAAWAARQSVPAAA